MTPPTTTTPAVPKPAETGGTETSEGNGSATARASPSGAAGGEGGNGGMVLRSRRRIGSSEAALTTANSSRRASGSSQGLVDSPSSESSEKRKRKQDEPRRAAPGQFNQNVPSAPTLATEREVNNGTMPMPPPSLQAQQQHPTLLSLSSSSATASSSRQTGLPCSSVGSPSPTLQLQTPPPSTSNPSGTPMAFVHPYSSLIGMGLLSLSLGKAVPTSAGAGQWPGSNVGAPPTIVVPAFLLASPKGRMTARKSYPSIHARGFPQGGGATTVPPPPPPSFLPFQIQLPRQENPNRFPPPKVEATSPSLPNWQQHYVDAAMSLLPHKTFLIDGNSQEFQVITQLLSPYRVTSVEQCVNPDLWRRYTNTRTEMLKSKSEDLELLTQVGFDEWQLQMRAHQTLNFKKDPLLTSESAKYSPNEVLLYHCTKDPENLENILNQGLDERLSATTGGLLGKGIYFADDPVKAVTYDGTKSTILIFAVLLGDCLSVQQDFNKMRTLVREPEKAEFQKRNNMDLFFDSITANMGGYNEYVIYNRYQCCPLYKVGYKMQPGDVTVDSVKELYVGRRTMPAIAWNPMPNQYLDGSWPFFAASLLEKMKPGGLTMAAPAPNSAALTSSKSTPTLLVPVDLFEKVKQLKNLTGIEDVAWIKTALEKFRNDVDDAGNFLLDNPSPPMDIASAASSSASSSSALTSTSAEAFSSSVGLSFNTGDDASMDNDPSVPNLPSAPAAKEECLICCEEYEAFYHSPQFWKELNCTHKLCLSCFGIIETKGTSVDGLEHTSIKCPFCQELTGTKIGTCPDGTMTVTVEPRSCDGYFGLSIRIEYKLFSNMENHGRIAYLPNTQEGLDVLNLLKTAWNRRLTFAIGTSYTTGAVNVPVWNIHHKTSLCGGVASHGYPDPGYFDRVKAELKTFGVE